METETIEKQPATLAERIAELGTRNGVAVAAQKSLEAAGKKYTVRAVQKAIARNGTGNDDIALAVFDALAQAQATRAALAQRRAALEA